MADGELPLSKLVANVVFEFAATVGTMLAVLVGIGAWSMHWPLVFIGTVVAGFVCYTAQRRGLFGTDVTFRYAVLLSVADIGPFVAVIGIFVSVLDFSLLWIGVFAAVGLVSLYLRLVLPEP
jgi:hypothetical protein